MMKFLLMVALGYGALVGAMTLVAYARFRKENEKAEVGRVATAGNGT